MSELKCPICNDGKIIAYLDGTYECDNHECSIYNGTHTETFEALIRTRKALEQSEICCTEWEKQALDYKAENIALSGDLARTRKALDVAKDALKSAHDYYEYCIQRDRDYGGDDINWDCTAMNMDNDISEALEQITALEQKDVK